MNLAEVQAGIQKEGSSLTFSKWRILHLQKQDEDGNTYALNTCFAIAYLKEVGQMQQEQRN